MKGALAAVLLAGARATYLYESMCSTDDGVCFSIKDKASVSMQLAEAIQTKFEAYQNTGDSATCTAFDTCNYGDSLAQMTVTCDANYGATEGCDCEGRAVAWDDFVVKATTAVTTDATDIMNAVCYTQGLETTFKSLATGDSDLKWMYYGTMEGVMVNYPGFYWGDCEGSTYDPRERPWFVSGATGPKDVIIVIDKSGSMRYNNRMEYAREGATTVVNSLTNIDFVSVVTFSSLAYSYNTVLVPAEYAYRQTLVNNIASITDGGTTYYTKAMTKAFEITANSDALGLTANCSRVYVFLTDGDPTETAGIDPFDEWEAEILGNKREHDMFFIVALGDGLTSSALDGLKSVACAIDGVFIQVADNDEQALIQALGAYYQYLAMGNMIAEVQPTRWSEPYYSIPDIYGLVTTAVTPVYDKRQEPWTMIGVAAVDLPMCELTEAAAAAGWTDDVADPSEVLTRQGCACADSYTYEGRTYTGCTTYDWATAWCGTVDSDCGICDEQVQGGASGCWDECDFSGSVEGKVWEALKEASSQCFPAIVAEEGLEVLRGTHTCTATVLTDEWTSLIETAKPNYGTVGEYDWVEGQTTEVGKDGFPCSGSLNDQTCEVCTQMTPSCATGECQSALESWESSGYCSLEDGESDGVDVGAIVGIVFGIVFAFAVGGFIMFAIKQSRGGDQGGGDQGGGMQMRGMRQQSAPPAMPTQPYAQPGMVVGAVPAPVQAGVMAAPVMVTPVVAAAPAQNKPIQARVVSQH